jgi:hypothetical protein
MSSTGATRELKQRIEERKEQHSLNSSPSKQISKTGNKSLAPSDYVQDTLSMILEK